MNKKQLRVEFKNRRNNLTLEEIDNYSIQIANLIAKLPIWDHSFYHVFLSIKSLREVNTEPLLAILSGKDKNIIVSKTDFEARIMTHILLQDSTVLKLNSHNIPEPVNGIEIRNKEIEVVFIPLVAFDNLGNRVGYGKSFYDVFLNECSKTTLKIGLSLFKAAESITDIQTHDIPLDYCITPNKVYKF